MQNSQPYYNYTMDISYHTDDDYQEQLKTLLGMDKGEHVPVLDLLYEQTKNDSLLVKLYTLAAEKQLLQSNPEMGLILLFSYDTFFHYHCLLQFFFSTIQPNSQTQIQYPDWNEENPHYKKIHQYFDPPK